MTAGAPTNPPTLPDALGAAAAALAKPPPRRDADGADGSLTEAKAPARASTSTDPLPRPLKASSSEMLMTSAPSGTATNARAGPGATAVSVAASDPDGSLRAKLMASGRGSGEDRLRAKLSGDATMSTDPKGRLGAKGKTGIGTMEISARGAAEEGKARFFAPSSAPQPTKRSATRTTTTTASGLVHNLDARIERKRERGTLTSSGTESGGHPSMCNRSEEPDEGPNSALPLGTSGRSDTGVRFSEQDPSALQPTPPTEEDELAFHTVTAYKVPSEYNPDYGGGSEFGESSAIVATATKVDDRWWKKGGNILVLVLIAAALAIGLGVGLSRGGSENGTRNEPLDVRTIAFDLVGGKIYTPGPYSAALTWIQVDSSSRGLNKKRVAQRFLLALLYFSTGGDNWIAGNPSELFAEGSELCESGSNCEGEQYDHLRLDYGVIIGVPWISNDHECTWFGIECAGGDNDTVTSIQLNENNLAGTLPSELSKMTSLRALSALGNALSGTLPSELALMKNLTVITLVDNEFTGTIPEDIYNMTQLTWLSLGYDQISGTLSTRLGQLTELKRLSLYGMPLNGTLPTEMGLMRGLEEVIVAFTRLSGSIPSELGNLQGITGIFGFAFNMITGTLPPELGKLQPSALYLQNNDLTGTIPDEMYNLSTLQGLALSNNRLSGTISTLVGNMKSLATFDVSNNNLSGAIPAEISAITNVTSMLEIVGYLADGMFDASIWLQGNQLNGTLPKALGKIENLAEFDASRNELTGTLPEELHDMLSLKVFKVSDNHLNGTISSKISKMSNLKELHISDNKLTGSIPEELHSMRRFEKIDVSNNLLSGSISPLIANLNNLEVFLVEGNAFTGTIPSQFGSMANITSIGMALNNFTGNVSDSICGLQDGPSKQLQYFSADCLDDLLSGVEAEVDCGCCTMCCNEDAVCANQTLDV